MCRNIAVLTESLLFFTFFMCASSARFTTINVSDYHELFFSGARGPPPGITLLPGFKNQKNIADIVCYVSRLFGAKSPCRRQCRATFLGPPGVGACRVGFVSGVGEGDLLNWFPLEHCRCARILRGGTVLGWSPVTDRRLQRPKNWLLAAVPLSPLSRNVD